MDWTGCPLLIAAYSKEVLSGTAGILTKEERSGAPLFLVGKNFGSIKKLQQHLQGFRAIECQFCCGEIVGSSFSLANNNQRFTGRGGLPAKAEGRENR